MPRARVLLVGPYDAAIPVLNGLLGAGDFAVTVTEQTSISAIPRLLSHPMDAAVVFISELHHAVELRALLQACPGVHFLLISPMKPPRAAVARVAHEFGAAIVPVDDGPLLVAATLVSMLAQASVGTESGG